MRHRQWSRRALLKAATAFAAGALFAQPLKAAAPPPAAVTPALIEAARKEGKVSFYTAIELNIAVRVGKLFEAKYPGIAVRIERSGAERICQRIAQEQASHINSVDVANSTEDSPLIIVPSGIFRSAPNPNAARLFQSFFFSAEAQQLLADTYALRSFHGLVKEKAGHTPLSAVKLLHADAAAVLAQSEEIKARYAKLFGV